MTSSTPIQIHVPIGIGRRLERANEHLQLLDAQVRGYLGGKPYQLRSERGTEETERELFVDVTAPFDELGWALLVSEIVHHYRASLDNLIYMLSVVTQGQHVSGTEFPIYLTEAAFRSGGGARGPIGPYKIRAIPPGAQAVIEGLQPWHTGQDDPLWMLHELSNTDKHRIPNLALALFEGSTYSVEPSPDVTVRDVEFLPGPLVDGAPIGRLHLDKTDPDARVDVEYKPTFRVAFGEGTDSVGNALPTNGKPILQTLLLIHDAVWSAVRDLQNYFVTQVTVTVTVPLPPTP